LNQKQPSFVLAVDMRIDENLTQGYCSIPIRPRPPIESVLTKQELYDSASCHETLLFYNKIFKSSSMPEQHVCKLVQWRKLQVCTPDHLKKAT